MGPSDGDLYADSYSACMALAAEEEIIDFLLGRTALCGYCDANPITSGSDRCQQCCDFMLKS
jgi:hypothetical protein